LGRFSAERRTTISGDGAAVETVSRWICLEADGSRPQRLEGEFRETFAASASGRDANVRTRHPEPPPDAERAPWSFRATDLDIAGHINNTHYWAPVEEEFLGAGSEPAAFDGEVEHRDPAQPGPAELLRVFLVSPVCASYCRFCTRRRKVGDPEKIPMSQFESAFQYLEAHTEIRDVIMSGGDPLLLNDRRLDAILSRLRSIKHIEINRNGSRVPCHLPERISPELCASIKKYLPVWFYTHFNHPDELTPAAV
jgi:hypothetical protein